ncbi:MAG: metallophosphoesterase [Clostridia bacterium]|nr:metallophosphoesterase [Clostridia bacterium]
MNKMKKWLSVILSVCLLGALLLPAAAAAVDTSRPTAAHLTFNSDGKLKILQLADIQDDAALSLISKKTIRLAIEASKPDLIMLTGDNIAGYSCKTKGLARTALANVMNILDDYNIPVAMVFGNHDDDGTPYTKLEQIAQYETYNCFIGCAGVVAEKTVGDNTTTNAGTYNIPVFADKDSDKVVFNIWCIDSGNYNPDPAYGGYGYVLPEQIDWYRETAEALKAANDGQPVPSIAFQHIVPPQIADALQEADANTPGAIAFAGKYYVLPDGTDPATNWLTEAPCPPSLACADGYNEVNAMLEEGDVKAIFFGHDHINSYVVNYNGIDLVSSPGCTYQSYNDEHRGFRVITIDKNDPSTYTSEILLATELMESDPAGSFMIKFQTFFDKIGMFFVNLWNKITAIFNK